MGKTAFISAAQSGNGNIAVYLLEQGATSDLIALQLAIKTGQSKLVRHLIDAGADVNKVDTHGYNALMTAAEGGSTEVAKLLLEHGASVHMRSHSGETALHLAVEHGQAATYKMFIKSGADPLLKTDKGFSLIHLAAKEGHLNILQDLIREVHGEMNQKAENGHVNDQSIPVKDIFDKSQALLCPLQLAAEYGHFTIVRELLKYPSYSSKWSRDTALFLASVGGFDEIVAELLQVGVTTVIKDSNGNNALHWATRLQYPNIVEKLLNYSPGTAPIFDVNKANDLSSTPLNMAIESGRWLTVHVLLQHNACLDHKNQMGRSPLHIAASKGHQFITHEILQYLQRSPQDKSCTNSLSLRDNDGNTAFTLAIRAGHLEVAKTIISAWPLRTYTELEGNGDDALHIAAECGNEDLVRFLLEKGWDVNAQGRNSQDTALHIASKAGAVVIVNLLLKNGANIDAEGQSKERPIHYAVRSHFNRSEVIQALMDGKANIDATDEDGATSLWKAAYGGQVQAVEELLKYSPNLDIPNNNNQWTPLHAAYDNASITQMLIGKGANLEARDNYGRPPFFLATEYCYRNTVRAYLDTGLDPNMKLADGQTALHVASADGSLHIVQLLVSQKADINARKKDGSTPLHLAVIEDRIDIVDYLLQEGADWKIECKEYGNALMAAVRNRNTKIITILLKAGAEINAKSSIYELHSAIQTAAYYGIKEAIEVLLQRGADVNINGGKYGSALLAAINEGNKEIAELLLNAGADINFKGGPKRALELAFASYDQEMIDLCLDPKRQADVDYIGNGRYGTALLAAIDRGHLETVDKILSREVNLYRCGNGHDETPMEVAIQKGRVAIVKRLAECGATLSFNEDRRRSALSLAVIWKSTDVIYYLLERSDIDINQRDANSLTPLMVAVNQGSMDVVERLLGCHADVNLRDQRGTTALMIAISLNYSAIVSRLIEFEGIDIFIKDVRGRDALYWAARMSWSDTFNQVMRKVKKAEADPSVYQNAVSAAVASNKYDFLEILLQEAQPLELLADEDGWNPLYSARMYRRIDMERLIKAAIRNALHHAPSTETDLKYPSQWHPLDMTPGLFLELDHKTITVTGELKLRHPQDTLADESRYLMQRLKFGVGFCEETAQLEDLMLGCKEGSWGYHGDGKRYESQWRGDLYGPLYGVGDTIGCGINVKEKTAFYTKNGKIIGRAFSNIRGKLFPAVSVDWENEQRGDTFMYRGPYTGDETLEEPQRAEDQGGEGNKQTEAEEIKRRSSHMFDSDSDDSDSDSYSSISD
ncbi:ankyrin-3 [Trichoderma arundinaceum]|uniref:Ankyrin-3 n=1 Tax=Trichoderma arundinaceum TaxID=490622 RepID=A0A395NW85_TRIAR|nr:ankyrin-3 [Trichoderma arundinaceum]